jgi:hypothetical protein
MPLEEKFNNNISYQPNRFLPLYVLLLRNPDRTSNRAAMARAFSIWSQRLPLQHKCTELENQMKERVLTISTLRDNYLRDVVALKYHVEKIVSEVSSFDNPIIKESLDKLSEHKYEMTSIPSANLNSLIQLAKNALSPSSEFLRDNLQKAGFLLFTIHTCMHTYIHTCMHIYVYINQNN